MDNILLYHGIENLTKAIAKDNEGNISGINGDSNETVAVDQEVLADKSTQQEAVTPSLETDDNKVIEAIKIKNASISDGDLNMTYSFTPSEGANELLLTGSYTGKIYLTPQSEGLGSVPPPSQYLGDIQINTNDTTGVIVKGIGQNEDEKVLDKTAREFNILIELNEEAITFNNTYQTANLIISVSFNNKGKTKRNKNI
jgi:hypothetical protein